MDILINMGVLLVACLHVWFCILEMYFWQKPLGLKVFKLNPERAAMSAPLAANQGLYNLFLSAGLFWGLLSPSPLVAYQVKIFFLACVIIAGSYAGLTVNKRIFWVQAFPAILTLLGLSLY